MFTFYCDDVLGLLSNWFKVNKPNLPNPTLPRKAQTFVNNICFCFDKTSVHQSCRVSIASGFYMRTIASPVKSAQFHAILHNSAKFCTIREQLLAIPHSCALFRAISRISLNSAQRNSDWKPLS